MLNASLLPLLLFLVLQLTSGQKSNPLIRPGWAIATSATSAYAFVGFEAAQAIELSTLIPLRYGCKRCILVGDPKQLPPTVISPKAERLRYSQSLFKRMYDQAQQDVYLLSIQYRMHPDISMHPSAAFYGGALRDGPQMDQLTARPWHRDDLLAPFRFFSIKGQERQTRGHSFVNPDEAHAALALYERLVRSSPDFDFDGKVGLVTGYKAQMIEEHTRR